MTRGLSKEEVYEGVREVLVNEFGLPREQVIPDAHLVKDLDLDSIDWIDMAVALESRTGHELGEEELAHIRTVRDIVDSLHRKFHGGPS
jgi:acyl carrier protein